MKKALCSILALSVLMAVAPAMAKPADPLKFRRTLFAPVGQRTLALEAPLKMCFIDPSYRVGQVIYNDMQEVLDDMDGGELLGIFTPCLDAAGFNQGASGTMPMFGIVTWLNPQVGETTPLSRHDYLEMAEKTISKTLTENIGGAPAAPVEKIDVKAEALAPLKLGGPSPGEDKTPLSAITGASTGKSALDKALSEVSTEAGGDDKWTPPKPPEPPETTRKTVDSSSLSPAYAALMLPFPGDYRIAPKARRTDAGVTVAYTAEIERDNTFYHMAGVAGTTVLQHAPVQVMISQTLKTHPDGQKLQALMDVFLAQQVALNR